MRTGRVVIAAAVGGTLLLGAALWARSSSDTARVDSGPVGERIVARAAVVPSAGVRHVFAAADGRIARVLAREGERVEPGQALAELEVAGRTVQLSAAQRGVVLARHCEVGDYALAAEHGATTPLFELADPSQTELRIEVEESDAARLVAELPVQINTIGALQASAAGQVTRVSARLERRTIGADDARVRADGLVRGATVAWLGDHPAWPLGMRAEASIVLEHRTAAARVPRAALSVRDGRTVVERPMAFWTREVPVEVVTVDDAFAEIRGLAPGSEVIIPKAATR